MTGLGQFKLQLLGPFRLSAPDGAPIEVSTRKGAALVAMLAMARDGERTRGWLQDRLWGSRQQRQAQGSLRTELLKLRRSLNAGSKPLLYARADRIRLDLSLLEVDAHRPVAPNGSQSQPFLLPGEFLEGFDIPGEDGFEDWLREQRGALAERLARAIDRPAPPRAGPAIPLPPHIVDLGEAAPGFGGRPSLAVLPFANLTGSQDTAYLAGGIGEDLVERLSRLRWIPVIASGSSVVPTEGALDPRAVGGALGARYLLQGRLSGSDPDFVLKVALFDADHGRIVWSEEFAIAQAHSRSSTDRLAEELVGVLETRLNLAEQERVLSKRVDNLSVNEMVWRARWHLNRYTREDAEIAKALIAKALALEPNSPDALIQATYALAWTVWTLRRDEAQVVDIRKLAQRAIAADPLDARGYMLAGLAETWLRKPARAKMLLAQAIELNPSLSHAHAVLGSTYYLNGEAAAAIDSLKTALRLSPYDEGVFRVVGELAVAHWMLGNFAAAIDHADQSLMRRPAYWYAHVIRINALAAAGDPDEARRARQELSTARPGFSESDIDWLPFVDPTWRERLKEGVRTAE